MVIEIFHKFPYLFPKVPLKDDPNFASVNVRELIMLTKVLPQLQEYLDTECDGFFRLPMPEVVHCYYDGNGLYMNTSYNIFLGTSMIFFFKLMFFFRKV